MQKNKFNLKYVLFPVLSLMILAIGIVAYAQNDHTASEEAEGKLIWEQLQAKQKNCDNISDSEFSSLGEYFIGLMIGDTKSHEFMNQMMINMMGEQNEEQMHSVMGKRLSGCNTNAVFPASVRGFMPMMMGGMFSGTGITGNMMGGSWGFSGAPAGWMALGWVTMLLLWALIIIAIITLVRWMAKK